MSTAEQKDWGETVAVSRSRIVGTFHVNSK